MYDIVKTKWFNRLLLFVRFIISSALFRNELRKYVRSINRKGFLVDSNRRSFLISGLPSRNDINIDICKSCTSFDLPVSRVICSTRLLEMGRSSLCWTCWVNIFKSIDFWPSGNIDSFDWFELVHLILLLEENMKQKYKLYRQE